MFPLDSSARKMQRIRGEGFRETRSGTDTTAILADPKNEMKSPVLAFLIISMLSEIS